MMKKVPPPVPIPQPPAPPPGLAADVVASGLPVHPEGRVRLDAGLASREDLREHFHDARVEFYVAGGIAALGITTAMLVAARR